MDSTIAKIACRIDAHPRFGGMGEGNSQPSSLADERGEDIARLYEEAIPATRTGPLYNAFSYPTKISPEAIALFIATHTDPGDTVLDVFSGSGTTGLAAKLCDAPTPAMIALASRDVV